LPRASRQGDSPRAPLRAAKDTAPVGKDTAPAQVVPAIGSRLLLAVAGARGHLP
jgi:hypothetical protein